MQAFARAARPLSLLVVSLALLLPDGQAQAQAAHGSTTASPAFDAALVEYERNHWPQAFAALSSLADGGHPEAARIAWQMWRFGAALYGQDFAATSRQLTAWSRLCGCGGQARAVLRSGEDIALRGGGLQDPRLP